MRTQENGKREENKREDKKALKKFFIRLLFSFVFGLSLGILTVFLKGKATDDWAASADWAVKQIGIFGAFVSTTVFLAAILLLHRQAKRLYANWDGEDEDVYRRIETKDSYALLLTNIGMIGGYFFFTLGAYVTKLSKLSRPMELAGTPELWQFLLVLLGMVYALAAMSIAQQKVVNFAKELNPEKQGSVYDMKFTDKWMETSDEAERFITYKSAYHAFRVMGVVFPAAWIVSLISMMAFDTGFFPVAIVLALWLVMTCTYSKKAIYYEKHPSEVMK